MHLSRHDLSQMDDEYLASLGIDVLRRVSGRLLSDLKEAHDRLNQNPKNSSRPPGSMPAYLGLPIVTDPGKSSNDADDVDDEEDVVAPRVETPQNGQNEKQGVAVDDSDGVPGPEGANGAVKGGEPSNAGTQ